MQEEHQTVVETDSLSEHTHAREISWRVHPLVENWKRSVLLMLFLSFILLFIYFGFQSIVVLLLSAILLVGPLYKYFLPFHYCCEIENLIVTTCCYKLERPWSMFRSYYVDKNGVLLSPFAKPTRLENFRGVYVRFGKHPPEEVVNYIRLKLNSES
ncbi:MAG: hypothetical protein OXM61_02460 [Candidatus Poribacteria bacterium]|nr:hypothetical protein [Candidatus Poribacteria bacterium]